MQQSRKMADHGAMQNALRVTVIRLAAQLTKVDPTGAANFINKLRHQNVLSALHEIEDSALRQEIDDLDNFLGRIARARLDELAALEKSINGAISPYRPRKAIKSIIRR